jgi:uncharacterized RDD family membrane protein YckC
LQCGSILRPGVRACTFCDSHLPDDASAEPAAKQIRKNRQTDQLADSVWRGELANRVASYRARRRKSSSDSGQPDLPFEQEVATPEPQPAISVAVAEPPPPASSDDFSFSIAIGRTANRKPSDEAQMYIDVSLPPSDDRPIGSTAVAPEGSHENDHTGLYPVASIEERRLAGLIDAACLLFACGGFLALFGSLGGHFALSKLSAVVYATSFAIVYLQYFALFTVFGGTTPGMMLRGLRVVDFSGEDPAPRQLLLRAAGYMLSAGTFFLGFLWAQWDEDELTWHDRISHTYLSSASSIADSELSGIAHTH